MKSVAAAVRRALGWRGLFALVAGAAVGVLATPWSGRETRARLAAWRASHRGGDDAQIAERVSFELSHAPRTWHLPQPEVVVTGATVSLRGTVPDDEARDEIARVARVVSGVREVDNQLLVPDADGAAPAR